MCPADQPLIDLIHNLLLRLDTRWAQFARSPSPLLPPHTFARSPLPPSLFLNLDLSFLPKNCLLLKCHPFRSVNGVIAMTQSMMIVLSMNNHHSVKYRHAAAAAMINIKVVKTIRFSSSIVATLIVRKMRSGQSLNKKSI
jgi:hypothetical protein